MTGIGIATDFFNTGSEVRLTVSEFWELSLDSRHQNLAWSRALLSESPELTSDELKPIILRLLPSDVRFYAEKYDFWAEQIPIVEEKIRSAGAEGLIKNFHDSPALSLWNLLHYHPENLLEFLSGFDEAMNKGMHKLSQLQKNILLYLSAKTVGGVMPAEWFPTELLVALAANTSQALKRLKERNLIISQSKKGGDAPKRTTHAKFTHIGFLVSKRLLYSQTDNLNKKIVFRYFLTFKKVTSTIEIDRATVF